MRFGLFGGASARRGMPTAESARGYHDFIEYQVEAEALGLYGSFVTEHHFTKIGQISATLNLLTWIAARTTTLRLGTAVIILPRDYCFGSQETLVTRTSTTFVGDLSSLPPTEVESP